MRKSTTYQIRLSDDEKRQTFQVFESLGVSPAQAVKLFFAQVRATHCLPFSIERKPNAETVQAIEDVKNGVGVITHKSPEDLFRSLGM